VECAVDAWLTFGGLGGRTRRGFGALKADPPKHPQTLFDQIQALGLRPLQGVAGFAGATLAIRQVTHANALNALETALGRLRQFRQGENTARTHRGHNPAPGRSWWPEAESIRRITGQSDPKHAMPLVALGRDVFPRAAFGMPIIFHFKDNNSRAPSPRNTDPSDTTLMPVDAERRASPLILRPFYSTSNNTHKTMALALRDPAVASEQCRLHPVADDVSTTLTQQEAAHLTRNPQPLPLNKETDVLAAFLSFF
jgi:CRISPR-associated protein Cmr1